MRRLVVAATVAMLSAPVSASASTLLADTVIDYFNSGSFGTFPGPADVFGGTLAPSNFPVAVPIAYATDGDANTFVSLTTNSFIVLGFSGGFVFDGPGNDIFVAEIGGNDEEADVFVSSDFGLSFTFLGKATTDTVSGFDLADIGFIGQVNAVKIVGLDDGGGSPGFDLAFVQGLEGSVTITPQPIPVPAALPLLATGLGLLALARRRRPAA